MEFFCFVCFHYRSATVGSWQARYRYKKNLKKVPGRRQLSKQVAFTSLQPQPVSADVGEEPWYIAPLVQSFSKPPDTAVNKTDIALLCGVYLLLRDSGK